MISIENVSKRFENHYGIKGVSTTIDAGSIYGLVGSNGSGKSTLLRMIAGVYRPDTGKVRLDGEVVFEQPATKERMVYISDDQYTDRSASIEEMAFLYSQFYPDYDTKMALDMAKRFGLDTKAKFKSFSKGMTRQAQLILGMAAKPSVMLCDETFDGLDPVKRRAIKALFSEMVLDHGATIIIASHNLRELEDICDHIGLLHSGKLVLQRSIEDLESNIFKLQLAFKMLKREEDFAELSPIAFEQRGRMISMIVRGQRENIMDKVDRMHPLYAEALPLTLEEIFITEMGVLGYDVEEIVR